MKNPVVAMLLQVVQNEVYRFVAIGIGGICIRNKPGWNSKTLLSEGIDRIQVFQAYLASKQGREIFSIFVPVVDLFQPCEIEIILGKAAPSMHAQ